MSVPDAIRGDPKHNIRIRAGDQLFIPSVTSQMITVLGDANQATPLAYRKGMRLTEALALAGGFDTIRGDRKDIRIIRGPLREPRVYTANLKDLTSGKATDVVLAPGDIVYVTKNWYTSAADVLNAMAPIIALSQSVATFALAYSIGVQIDAQAALSPASLRRHRNGGGRSAHGLSGGLLSAEKEAVEGAAQTRVEQFTAGRVCSSDCTRPPRRCGHHANPPSAERIARPSGRRASPEASLTPIRGAQRRWPAWEDVRSARHRPRARDTAQGNPCGDAFARRASASVLRDAARSPG